MKKRYAIVRVDNNCPMWTERFSSFTCEDMFRCSRLWQIGQDTKCRDFCRYGDTKEQLVMKIAQALEICKNKGYRNITSEEYAKEIVEFLGVE